MRNAEWREKGDLRRDLPGRSLYRGEGPRDSFFGNISAFDGSTIYISQTASSSTSSKATSYRSRDGSSTAGISASSELPAHKAIYLSTDYRTVLHGHPKFSVIMSMHCTEEGCDIEDCTRNCDRKGCCI